MFAGSGADDDFWFNGGLPMTSDWAGQIAALFDEAEAAPPGAERAAVLCRIAEIQERRMADPNGALSVLETALSEAPASGRVIEGLERIARNNGMWSELVAMASAVAEGLEDSRLAADLWVQIAFWNETGRAQLDEAVAAAEAALQLEASHGGALAVLGNLLRRLRKWDGYVAVLDNRRDLSGLDTARLVEGYREVLRYEPRHPGALDGLARALEEQGEWAESGEVLRRLIDLLPEGAQQVAARHRLASLLAEHLAEPRAAEEQLLLALASPAGSSYVPSLLLLATIYRRRSDWLKARQMLARAAEAASDPVDRARYLGEAAEICEVHLDDEAQAAELYAAVLALDDTRDDLAEKLADLRFRRGDLAGSLPLAERLVARAAGKPPADQARLQHRLGRAREAAGDDAGAREAYRAAAGEGPPATEEAHAALADSGRQLFPPARVGGRGGGLRAAGDRSGDGAARIARGGVRAAGAGAPAGGRAARGAGPAGEGHRAGPAAARGAAGHHRGGACCRRRRRGGAPHAGAGGGHRGSQDQAGSAGTGGDHPRRAAPGSAPRHRRLLRSAGDLARTKEPSCTGCWSCCPRPSSGSRWCRSCASWPRSPRSRRARPT